MPAIQAVLLDVGGVFHLPDHDHLIGAFARAGVAIDPGLLDRAHYAGAARFTLAYDGDLDWKTMWGAYLDAYTRACEVPDDRRDDVLEHLRAEFAVAALWSRVIPGSREALRALADTGTTLGVVSNADGSVAARLAEQEVLQVGPGPGVPVATIIDSGAVGVQKPDPRIFHLALDALDVRPEHALYVGDMPAIDVVGARKAGIRPVVMDPFGFQADLDCDRVATLTEVGAFLR